MKVEDGPRSSCPSCSERTPSEERMQVVSVDHVRPLLAHGVAHLLRIEPARHQAMCRCRPADWLARALEQLYVVAVRPQQLRDVGDRTLLAAMEAVAVM